MTGNRRRLASAAIISAFGILLSACGAQTPAASSSVSTSTSSSTSAASTAATVSPDSNSSAASTTEASSAPASTRALAGRLQFECSAEEDGTREKYASLQELWKSGQKFDLCDVEFDGYGTVPEDLSKSELSDLEWKAVQKSYPDKSEPNEIEHLYGICAQTSGIPIDEVVSDMQAEELSGALLLCPDHPKIKQMTANASKFASLQAEESQYEADVAAGRLIHEGNYLVGEEISAGTWRTVGDKITECYWEITDKNGNIMVNNFVSTSGPFNVKVPASASGFTINGCSFRLVTK